MNPEQLVFTNSFALESMIQACNAAKDEAKLKNAINRLKSFATANQVVLDMKQQKKLADVMARQKKTEAWTATVETAMSELNSVLEGIASGTRGRKHTAISGAVAVGESPEEIRNSPITAFDTITPGRKVFMRIDREHGVVYTTYRLYLEGVTPDLEEDETFGSSREQFLLAAQRGKMSRTANYHMWDNIAMTGKYIGKVRRHGKMFDSGKKFVIYDDGHTALADRNWARKFGATAPGAAAAAAVKAPGALASGAKSAAKASAAGASAAASATAKGASNAKKAAQDAKLGYQHKYREKDSKGTMISVDGQPMEAAEAPEAPDESEAQNEDLVSTGPMQSGEGDIFQDKSFRGDDDEDEKDENARQEVGALLFREEKNLNMVHLLCSHTGKPIEGSVMESWEKDKTSVFHLSNKHPVWNEDSQMWSLGFEGQGRVVLASSKNFVMEGEDGKTYMQFGKQGANSFTLDVRSPLTPFLAFSYAMAFFEL